MNWDDKILNDFRCWGEKPDEVWAVWECLSCQEFTVVSFLHILLVVQSELLRRTTGESKFLPPHVCRLSVNHQLNLHVYNDS